MPKRVCRTCFKVMHNKSEFFSIGKTGQAAKKNDIKTKLEACVPELQLDCVKDSVMCNVCICSLNLAYEFKTKCLDIESKLSKYMSQAMVDVIDLDVSIGEITCDKNDKDNNSKSTGNSIRCLACDKWFSAVDFKRHMNTHMSPLKCIDCDYQTNSQMLLDKHSKTHKQKPNIFKCNHCDFKSAINFNYRRHMKIHGGKEGLQCNKCSFNTHSSLNYRMHVKTHEAFNCEYCDYTSQRRSNLKKHVYRNHKNGKKSQDVSINNNTFNFTMDDIAFILENDNIEELFKEDGGKANDLETYFVSEQDVIDVMRDTDAKMYLKGDNSKVGIFLCPICKMSFKYKYLLNKHLSEHNDGNQPFRCTECGYSDHRKGSFKLHMTLHTGGKIYDCDKCNYRTLYYSTFLKHNEMHNKHDIKACDHCDFKTSSVEEMNNHIKTHVNLRCAECSFETASVESMQQHLDTHVIGNDFMENSLHQHLFQSELVN